MILSTPFLGLVAAFVLSGAAPADETPAATAIPNVDVIAHIRRNVPQLVEQFGQAYSGDRLSRWRTPVCPKVAGLGAEQNGFIADRIIQISRGARLEAPAANCEPNIYIVFSNQDLADRKTIASHSQGLLTDSRWPADVTQTTDFVRDDGAPVHVYYVTGQTSPLTNGPTIADFSKMTTLQDGSKDSKIKLDSLGAPVVPTMPSRLNPDLDSAFIRAVVIVDGHQLKGVTQVQIAAYLAMITFAEIRVAQPVSNVDTIANLFSDAKTGRKPADDLTYWDRAYLGALYNASTQINISMQRKVMANRIEHSIEVMPAPPASPSLDASSLRRQN